MFTNEYKKTPVFYSFKDHRVFTLQSALFVIIFMQQKIKLKGQIAMKTTIYHSDEFLNEKSTIYKREHDLGNPIVHDSETTLEKLYKKGWRLNHAVFIKSNSYTLFLEKD